MGLEVLCRAGLSRDELSGATQRILELSVAEPRCCWLGLLQFCSPQLQACEQLYEFLSCSRSSALCTDYVGIQGTLHDMTWHGMI